MSPWVWLPLGYLLSVAIEAPILLAGLSSIHPWKRKLFAAFWLTACTYPVVALTLPVVTGPYYLAVAETFAPLCECIVFLVTFGGGRSWRENSMWRDAGAILAANLASFGVGWWIWW